MKDRRGAHHNSALVSAITGVALVLALPIGVMVTSPPHTDAPEWQHAATVLLPQHAKGTLLLLAGTLIPALLLAVPSAWLVACTTPPANASSIGCFSSRWRCPPASAHSPMLLGPTNSLSAWLDASLGMNPDLLHLPGLCLVLAAVLSQYIYLPARAAFTLGMTAQLDAARSLGAGPLRRFTRVALLLAWPAIAAGALLVAIETLNDYGAVRYFGERTLTTAVFRSWGGLYDLDSALRLGSVLILLVDALLWVDRRSRRWAGRSTDQVPTTPILPTGHRAAIAVGWCAMVLALGAGLPLAKILVDVAQASSLTDWQEMGPAFSNTLLVAALAAAVTLAAAVAFTFRERHGQSGLWAIRLANLGYAIPGAVIAVGAMAAVGAIDRSDCLPFPLIGSLGLLIHALAARFLAVGNQPLRAGLEHQPKALDESAQLLGASPLRIFRRINLPLFRPALIAATMLVAIDFIQELLLTLILRPFASIR
ncbi:MAG: hypothetical protein QY325_02930 [Flavobacteriales bacterium]|nr:MAG: hypothetical protein QY325_02930 [Flavobacteriales bacterium]